MNMAEKIMNRMEMYVPTWCNMLQCAHSLHHFSFFFFANFGPLSALRCLFFRAKCMVDLREMCEEPADWLTEWFML